MKDRVKFVANLMNRLEEANLEPYIYYLAETGSVYIKFFDERLRSLRVGDHDGIEKYRYKWNLRYDLKEIKEDSSDGVRRFYYPSNRVMDLVKRIVQYKSSIDRSDKDKTNKKNIAKTT